MNAADGCWCAVVAGAAGATCVEIPAEVLRVLQEQASREVGATLRQSPASCLDSDNAFTGKSTAALFS